mmetsp:Transcript_6236/g.13647  ORF Transcript_6236/g.13647 Transcript_6236/m.13647 type:complete len:875 (-) Transcript_6236:563-3187(-)|eukprot:CAMPEP_0202898176 /NCGR_PEP_ID=MMETSP1392-20130828/6761_1 /ASSEMBLY_ACC=CAM_ASM_000868 /TAXON_ID=225041 /ORGANISM="Chlamydomonas chlamydogama, Strain SAG 11-48b" /LENGTH=874 /DNA_ID=CAMNT_0049584029 /DNA_START=245 /DNA_END=2869 /DNA_ORIENTATION=+
MCTPKLAEGQGLKPLPPAKVPISMAAAQAVLAAHPVEANPFIRLLAYGAPSAWFAAGQAHFLAAVSQWSQLLGQLVSLLPHPHQRLIVLHNLLDEHGQGDLSLGHVSTFTTLLASLGVHVPANYLDQAPHTHVAAFLNVFRSMSTWEELAAAMGMVEYSYAFVSEHIAKYCAAKGVVNAHYTMHQDLDMDHAQQLFSLVEGLLLEPGTAAGAEAVRRGMARGHAALMDLYEALADVHGHSIAFSNVMEDCAVERAILQDIIRQNASISGQQSSTPGSDSASHVPRVCIISSAGCTALSMLAVAPLQLDLVDVNHEQVALTDLKLQAVQHYASSSTVSAVKEEAAAAQDRYVAFLHGSAPKDNYAALAGGHAYWASKMQHLHCGLVHMGKYEAVFRKVAAMEGDTAAFQAGFGDETLLRQFGPRVIQHASRPLAGGFELLVRGAGDKPGPGGARNQYFDALVNGCQGGHCPAPWHAAHLSTIVQHLQPGSGGQVRLHACSMTEFLEAAEPASYDFVQVSNVTDWMEEYEVARLLRACRRALRPGSGRLLMRRIFGRFTLEDLSAYGFETVAEHADASGLYTQTVEFKPAREPTTEELQRFEERLGATYPLGPGQRFKISHGADYLRFFRRMGEVHYQVIRDGESGEDGEVVAAVAIVLRPSAPGQDQGSSRGGGSCAEAASSASQPCWYVGDLRVDVAHRGKHLPEMMMGPFAIPMLTRSMRCFAVEMLPEAGAPSRMRNLLAMARGELQADTVPLEIWSLPAEAVRSHWQLISQGHGGPSGATLLDLSGVKDLQLVPSGQALRVLHVVSRSSLVAGDVAREEPEAGAMHMVCCVPGSALSSALGGSGLSPMAHACVVHLNMGDVDWNCLSTADI